MAYAGTAGHQKMRKLGGQSGAAASFAGEPARGALIEEAEADRTTLARFSATVEAELLTDDEAGEADQQAFVDVTDEDALKASFSRCAKEEHEALKRGRTWIGATDTLAERLPAFFTGQRPPIWKWRLQRQQVRLIGKLKVSVTEETTIVEVPEEPVREDTAIPVLPVAPPAPSVDAESIVSDVVPSPTLVPPPAIEGSLPKGTTPSRQERKKRREQPRSTLVFGNVDHIQLVRRKKATARRAVKKPRVQVEVKEIPAMVAEEQPPQKVTSHKKTKHDQGQTLWDFLAQEPFPEPEPEPTPEPVRVLEPQQQTLF